METKKMSLTTIQGKLSRTEMKNIMAGSGSGGCYTGSDCTLNQAACVFSSWSGKARSCRNIFCWCC